MNSSNVGTFFLCYHIFIFRYNSFLPYDHNRVCLEKVIEDDDYINASWINKENNGLTENILIASQGPLPNTIVHFSQMIVEQKVEVIVMLCLPIEKNKQGNMIDTYENRTESLLMSGSSHI